MKTIRERVEEIVHSLSGITRWGGNYPNPYETAISQIEKLIEEEKDEAFADGVERGLEVAEDDRQT